MGGGHQAAGSSRRWQAVAYKAMGGSGKEQVLATHPYSGEGTSMRCGSSGRPTPPCALLPPLPAPPCPSAVGPATHPYSGEGTTMRSPAPPTCTTMSQRCGSRGRPMVTFSNTLPFMTHAWSKAGAGRSGQQQAAAGSSRQEQAGADRSRQGQAGEGQGRPGYTSHDLRPFYKSLDPDPA